MNKDIMNIDWQPVYQAAIANFALEYFNTFA